MNLHLMLDEKVINRTIRYFEEALPNNNKYIIILEPGKTPQLVQYSSSNVCFTEYGSHAFWEFIGDTRAYSNIVIHFLSKDAVRFVLKIPDTSNLTWIVWGADFYVDMLANKGFELYAYPEDVHPHKTLIGKFYSKIIFCFFYVKKLKAVSKIPYVVMQDCDYDLLVRYFPYLHPRRREFFYYPVDDMISKGIKDAFTHGNNIFVGNSASYTNNHRMVFERLSELDLRGRKVYVPLSYGEDQDYVLAYGKELLGDHFCPIIDFLPLEQYNNLMFSSNTFIYGNYRQEALGNILVALYIGGSVVLHLRNPLLRDLRKLGLILFEMNDLDRVLNQGLSMEERLLNRNLINTTYSRKHLLELIKSSFGRQ